MSNNQVFFSMDTFPARCKPDQDFIKTAINAYKFLSLYNKGKALAKSEAVFQELS